MNESLQAKSDLELLEKRSYKTYQCRLRAAQRLSTRSRAWNAFLISTSAAAVVASIGLLSDPGMYGGKGPTMLVCVSVLTLIASLVASGLDYSGRSRNMFLNYRRVQQLSAEAERAKGHEINYTREIVESLNRRYDALLDESENHTEADYHRAFPAAKKSLAVWREQVLTVIPYMSLAIPSALIVPLARWLL